MSLIQADLLNLPFTQDKQKVDAIVLSSILHEIYSFLPDGCGAWQKAIVETAQCLKTGGVLFIRDFAAPNINLDATFEFKNIESEKFYYYFRENFRTFKDLAHKQREAIFDKRIEYDDFPMPNRKNGRVTLPLSFLSEMMMHFRNYCCYYNRESFIHPGIEWKEINERYFMPDPYNKDFVTAMPPKEYLRAVLRTANQILKYSGLQMICTHFSLVDRHKIAEFLQHFFQFEPNEFLDYKNLFNQLTCKMEYLFKKVSL